jgi:hypothetical protein
VYCFIDRYLSFCTFSLAIVLSVFRQFTVSDHPCGILWPLCCLSFVNLRFLTTSVVSSGDCIVCHSSIYGFWLPLWYLVAIVLSVILLFTVSDYLCGILWPLYCFSFVSLRFLTTPVVSCDHWIVCHSSIYDFWLPLLYLVAIVLFVIRQFTVSDYPCGILWPLRCLSFVNLRFLIISLVSCGHCIVCHSSIYGFWLPLLYLVAIVLSVIRQFTVSDYPCGIVWPLYCLSFFYLRFLITPLVYCGHYIVCHSSIYGFWLPLWYLVAIMLSLILLFTVSDYPCGFLWPLCCLSFFYLRFLITPVVFSGNCVVCHSSIYGFWLPLWYLVAIVLSVILLLTVSDYPCGILWPLCCLFFYLRFLITPLVSSNLYKIAPDWYSRV